MIFIRAPRHVMVHDKLAEVTSVVSRYLLVSTGGGLSVVSWQFRSQCVALSSTRAPDPL